MPLPVVLAVSRLVSKLKPKYLLVPSAAYSGWHNLRHTGSAVTLAGCHRGTTAYKYK